MPTQADVEAATPKCPRGDEPMWWYEESLSWFCPIHGSEIKGVEVARRAGLVPWVEAEAA